MESNGNLLQVNLNPRIVAELSTIDELSTSCSANYQRIRQNNRRIVDEFLKHRRTIDELFTNYLTEDQEPRTRNVGPRTQEPRKEDQGPTPSVAEDLMPRDIMSSEPRHWMVFGQLAMPVQCCAEAPAAAAAGQIPSSASAQMT